MSNKKLTTKPSEKDINLYNDNIIKEVDIYSSNLIDMKSTSHSNIAEPLKRNPNLDTSILTNAQEGDSTARFDLGKSFYAATNINDNWQKAFYWLKLAADQRDMEAQFLLADLYALGKGTEKSEFDAYKWYLKSAIQGHPKALTRLHNLYNVEKNIFCRGQVSSNEEKWTLADFKKEHNIRELFEYRVEQLKSELTHIKQYFENLVNDCRQKDTEEAYLTLGFLYQHGYGIRKIVNRAIEHYLLAAKKGNIDAQYNLGYIYHHNTDLKWNYRESFKWYSKAAEKGQIHAQSGLAFLYLKGLGVDINYSNALFWYTKAAENRNVEAQISLAQMFRTGHGVTQNYTKAFEWYKKAANEGNTIAQNCIYMLVNNKKVHVIEENSVTQDKYLNTSTRKGLCSKLRADILSLSNLIDTKKLEKLAMHAMIGDAHAMSEIGQKYYNGNDLDQDKDIAFKWILRSAKTGSTAVQYIVATMYKEGDCVEQNYNKASIWYMKAARKGYTKAQYNIGLMYYQGLGVRKDPLEASKWFIKAADKNDSDAQYYIGILRLNGEGLGQDTHEAIKYLIMSTKQKNSKAINKLAKMYHFGNEFRQDRKQAVLLFQIAAQKGDIDAQMFLGEIYSGQLVPYPESSLAVTFYKMASEGGHPEAKHRLALMYIEGYRVVQNYITAYRLFKEAKELHYKDAENIFNIPIDFRRNADIDYDKITTMFTLVCKEGIDSLELNVGYIYDQDFEYRHNNSACSSSREIKVAKEWYQIAAKKNVSEAQYRLGLIYEEESNEIGHLSKAIDYYTKASKNNSVDATYKLALIYLNGHGVSQDFKISYNLFRKASDLGHNGARDILNISQESLLSDHHQSIIEMHKNVAMSGNIIIQYRLGLYYFNNRSLENVYSEAVRYFEMASEGGITDAFHRLGLVNEEWLKEAPDYQKAFTQYRIAADKGHEKALNRLARLYLEGKGIKQDYHKAFMLYSQAALKGDSSAQIVITVTAESDWKNSIGNMDDDSKRSLSQYNQYLQMWKAVAKKGNTNVQYSLGIIYEKDKCNPNFEQAALWYSQAAKASHRDALYRLGRFYEKGKGVEQDFKIAINNYSISGEAGNNGALYHLGTIFKDGKGVVPDFPKAIFYYRSAAEKKSNKAQFTLGMLYEEGIILQKDLLESIRWYTKAALNESELAHHQLLRIDQVLTADSLFYRKQFKLLAKMIERLNNIHQYDTEFIGDIHCKLGFLYYNGWGTLIDSEKAWCHFSISGTEYKNEIARELITIKCETVGFSAKDDYLKKLDMYTKVAEKLTSEEKYELGLIYYHGVYSNLEDTEINQNHTFIEPDYHKAAHYFKTITLPGYSSRTIDNLSKDNGLDIKTRNEADRYYSDSSFHLGMVHYIDIQRNNNTSRAFFYFNKAAGKGHPRAESMLDMINHGQGDIEAIEGDVFNWHIKSEALNDISIDFNLGWMYLEGFGVDQDYKQAFNYIRKVAIKGVSDAQYELGQLYEKGLGVERDQKNAIIWYKNAGKQSHVKALFFLGEIYFSEQWCKNAAEQSLFDLAKVLMGSASVEKDPKQAIYYYEISAKLGYCEAQYKLGYIYEKGIGIETDYDKAISLYNEAVMNNKHVLSSFSLGSIYLSGKHVEKDYSKALFYLKIAADQGYGSAQFSIGTIYNGGLGVQRNSSLAAEYFTKAAAQGNIGANNNLGYMYLYGNGVEQSIIKSFENFKVAAINGESDSQYQVGFYYFYGHGVQIDSQQAIEWYTKSAAEYHTRANHALGDMYFYGLVVEKDYEKALGYYIISAGHGWTASLTQVGNIYYQGLGVEKDLTKASRFFIKAENKNSTVSSFKLGQMFFYGEGVEKDYKKALEHYQAAADNGDEQAQRIINRIHKLGQDTENSFDKVIVEYEDMEYNNGIIANYTLGEDYFWGNGVVSDYSLAFLYYQNAALRGYPDAQFRLGYCYENGYGVEINHAQVLEWYSKAAAQGHIMANFDIGEMYFYGNGVDVDYDIAFQHYKAAADQGDYDAQFSLGYIYHFGYGIERDYSLAIQWYTKASQENEYARIALAEMFHTLSCEFQNFSKALEWYQLSLSEASNGNALRGIGLLHEHGDGVEQDYTKALEYYLQSAEAENKGAYYNIARLYYYGYGVEQSFTKSLEWFNKVIEEELIEECTYAFVYTDDTELFHAGSVSKEQKRYSMVQEQVLHEQAHYYIGIMNERGQGINKNHSKVIENFQIAVALGVEEVEKFLGKH